MLSRSRTRRTECVVCAVAIWSIGCAPSPAEPPAATTVHVHTEAEPEEPAVVPSAGGPRVLADDAPLESGLVRFDGMVVPTKGGLDIRGVVFSEEELSSALRGEGVAGEALLGAKVRVVVELARVDSGPEAQGEVVVQRRAGVSYHARKLISAEVVAPPERIEGEVRRSKGFYSVGDYLVTRDDLAWALVGKEVEGARVRLWGQPRIVVCEPEAQCLIGGELPIFDVGRAEIVK